MSPLLPDDPQLPEDEVRRRQRGRALMTALALGAFVILLYFVAIAKMAVQ